MLLLLWTTARSKLMNAEIWYLVQRILFQYFVLEILSIFRVHRGPKYLRVSGTQEILGFLLDLRCQLGPKF